MEPLGKSLFQHLEVAAGRGLFGGSRAAGLVLVARYQLVGRDVNFVFHTPETVSGNVLQFTLD